MQFKKILSVLFFITGQVMADASIEQINVSFATKMKVSAEICSQHKERFSKWIPNVEVNSEQMIQQSLIETGCSIVDVTHLYISGNLGDRKISDVCEQAKFNLELAKERYSQSKVSISEARKKNMEDSFKFALVQYKNICEIDYIPEFMTFELMLKANIKRFNLQ